MTFKDNSDLRFFYDGLHQKSDLRFPLADYAVFGQLLALDANTRLLDVACGKGFFLEANAGRCRGVGIDFSRSALEGARGRGVRDLCKGEAERLPFKDDLFDVVVNLGSLEHFLDKGEAVREMCRVVNREGRIMIIVPNGYDLKTIWKVFRTGRGNDQDGQEETTFMGYRDWRDLLEQAGLVVERPIKYNGFATLDWFYKRKDPKVVTLAERVIRVLLTAFLRPLIPMNLSAYFIFICKPVKG